MTWDVTKRAAGRVALVYLAVSLLWILTSDWLLLQLTANKVELAKLEIAKGFLFVTLTTVLVYILSIQAIGAVQARLEAALALSESEARFRSLFQRLPIGVYYAGVDGAVTEMNRRGRELLGLDGESVGFEGWSVGNEGKDRVQFAARRRAAIAAGKFYCEEYDVVRGHHAATMLDIGHPVFDENQNLTGYLGTLSDMTDLRRTNASLALRDEQYQALLARSAAGFMVLVDGEIIYHNDAFQKLMGGASACASFSAFLAAFGAEDSERLGSAIQECLVGDSAELRERVTLERRDGARVWLALDGFSGHWDEKAAFVATLIDQSGLLPERDRLERSEIALGAAPEPMAYIDTSGRLRDPNPAMTALCGLAADVPLELSDWMPSNNSLAIIKGALDSGQSWEGRISVVNAEKKSLEVNAKVVPLATGEKSGAILWLRDESERDRLTLELARCRQVHEATGLGRREALLTAGHGLGGEARAVICVFHLANVDGILQSAGLVALDQLLVILANELRAVFPKNTVIASVTEQDMAVLLTDVTGTNMATAMAKDAIARMQKVAIDLGPLLTTAAALIEPDVPVERALEQAMIASRKSVHVLG